MIDLCKVLKSLHVVGVNMLLFSLAALPLYHLQGSEDGAGSFIFLQLD